jgi:ribosomal protein S6E (S10)
MMRHFLFLIVCAASASCAARANLTLLDSKVGDGTPTWTFYKGSACDFKLQNVVCVSGIDEGTAQSAKPYRPVELTSTIVESIASKVPGFRNDCDGSRRRIRVEYQGGYSHCTHCGSPYLGQRFGMAFVRVESAQGWTADTTWTDTRGGSAGEVALRFAEAFATFLADARTMQCNQPADGNGGRAADPASCYLRVTPIRLPTDR